MSHVRAESRAGLYRASGCAVLRVAWWYGSDRMCYEPHQGRPHTPWYLLRPKIKYNKTQFPYNLY
eukprot:20041-Rhodomonas_salina.2